MNYVRNIFILFTLLTSSVAFAGQEIPAEEAIPTWSVGSGLALSTNYIIMGDLPGYKSHIFYPRPLASLLVERRISESASLMLTTRGGYSASEGEQNSYDYKSGDITLGGRYLINPGSAVELSPFAVFGAGFSESGSDQTDVQWGQSSYGFSATTGMVAEKQLMESLYLRVTLPILTAQIHASKEETTDPETGEQTTEESEMSGIGFDLTPSIELRMTF